MSDELPILAGWPSFTGKTHNVPKYCWQLDWDFLLGVIERTTGDIVEIGTLLGDTAYEISAMCAPRKLFCFDLPWSEVDPAYKTLFEGGREAHKASCFPHVILQRNAPNWQIPPSATVIFIDGDHSMRWVKHDTQRVLQQTRGRPVHIIWHDYFHATGPDVKTYLHQLRDITGYDIKQVQGTLCAYLSP